MPKKTKINICMQLVSSLLRCKIDVNAKNVQNRTALDIAEDENLPEIRNLLCSVGAARACSLGTDANLSSLRYSLRY